MTGADFMQFGASLLTPESTLFRLWAPGITHAELELEHRDPVPMARRGDGWFEATIDCGAGMPYRFRVSQTLSVPDPAARQQRRDVHDPSVVVDPDSYAWQHPNWAGRPWHEAIIYELHVGCFGGFDGVTDQLPRLARLGVTAIELMPLADFPGGFNWGYDGVLPYAPDASYGHPDDLKRLIDTAHGLELMVLLDVVYNHFGPDGNYLTSYAPGFYRDDVHTPWGAAIDFGQQPVRRFFIENAIYWLNQYRFDGLRFDAVHAIDDGDFLPQLAREIRAAVAPPRHIHLVLENEHKDVAVLRAGPDDVGFDAQWADDLHHCLHVMLTGEHEGYYALYADRPAEILARCLRDGFGLPGPSARSSAHLPVTSFVTCLQNHDQIGNRAFGERLVHLADPEALRAATALVLLCPQIPLLFMGEEWGASSPFLFFANHTGSLAEAVTAGRRREFAKFSAFSAPERRETIPDPTAPATFAASRPDPSEADKPAHAPWLALYSTLIAIRTTEIIPRLPGTRSLDAAALGPAAVRARWRMGDGRELTIALNLGEQPAACPPAAGRVLFSTPADPAGASLAPRSIAVVMGEAGDAA